jgi:hypothetical protein
MLGVGIGAALAFANFWVVARLVRRFVSGTASAPWSLVVLVKFGALALGFWFLLHYGVVDLLPLILGYAALPVGIVVAQLGAAEPLRERG